MADKDLCDKSELCIALGWSKPRLDRRLESDSNFPVRSRGTQAGGWEFHLPTVIAYLAQQTDAPRPGRPPLKNDDGDRKGGTEKPPAAPAEHQGEATAKQRRDNAQAQLLEDKLRRERGELVEVEEVRLALTNTFAHLGKCLDSLPELIVKTLSLPESATDRIRDLIDEQRRALAADLATFM